jgi:hypothetical protein
MTALLAVGLLVAGAIAAGYRLRWVLERSRAERIQKALDNMHEQFGQSMDAYYKREAADRARKAQLRQIIERVEDGIHTAPTDPELDRIRLEEYARLVKPS